MTSLTARRIEAAAMLAVAFAVGFLITCGVS